MYGLPLPPNKIADLSALWDEIAQYGGIVRILIDHADQLKFLEDFESQRKSPRQWSVFVKIDAGSKYVLAKCLLSRLLIVNIIADAPA